MSSPDAVVRSVGDSVGPAPGAQGDESDVDAAALRVAGAQGVKWSFIQTVGGLIGRLSFTFVLVRLVGPDDFGVVAQATIYIGLLEIVMDQGFGAALVQRRVLDPRDVGSVTWMNVGTGLVLAVITVVLAPGIADFFNTPELSAVLRVLAIAVVIKSFQLVPRALIRRNLLFQKQALIDMTAIIVSGCAGIAAALLDGGYWALVIQTIVYESIVLIGSNVLVWRFRSFRGSRSNLRGLWAFSIGLLGAQFLTFFGQNFDNLLIGRFESARQLAFYALSYRLLRLPLQMVGGVANTVSLPIFARLQDDDETMSSWFLRSTSLVALVCFPLLTLLIVGARTGVPVVFGDQWRPAVTPLMILCVAGMGDVVRMLMAPVAQAKARTDLSFWWALATAVTRGAAFVVGVQFGIVGVAIGYTFATLFLWPLNIAHFSRVVLVRMTMPAYGHSLLPAATGSLVLAASWLAVNGALSGLFEIEGLLAIALSTPVALFAYAATVRLLFPRTLAATRDIGRLMLRRAA